MKSNSRNALFVIAVLLGCALLWEALTRLFKVPVFMLPPPSAVLVAMKENPSIFVYHATYTLESTLLGFALAVVLGVVLAVAIVQSRLVERTLYTVLVSLNSVPKVAVAPLFILWLGTGIEPKIAIAAMIAIFAIVIDMVHGLKSVEPEMLDLGRALKGSRLKVLVKIQFPHALPSLFSGMKVAISLALIGAIVGEFVAAKRGLGYLILLSQGQFDTTTMFGAIVILALLGIVLFFIIDALERLALPWHASRRQEGAVAVVP
ncbi:MAG TPA: ABC transporter permease [Burkholderiales bacterium]|jgi:NitT/TauT family transport system permease protein|nr:ABC transporter permease [Burkholderiales bacterium]